MLCKIFPGLTKVFIKIFVISVLVFLHASCSDKITNPEENTDDLPILGSSNPINRVYDMGEGDLKFRIRITIMFSPKYNYNVVAMNFTDSKDPIGIALSLSPDYAIYSFIQNLGQTKIKAFVTLYPASSNLPGRISLTCSYSKLDGSDAHYFTGIICQWNLDESM